MRLARVDAKKLVFTDRARLGPTALSACLLAGAAVVPLAAPSDVTPLRILTSVLLAVAAAAFARMALTRSRRVEIDSGAGLIASSFGTAPLTRVRAVALAQSDPTFDEGLRPRYCAELVLDDGRRLPILARDEPAGVLADLLRLRAVLPVPVTSGWGLDDAALGTLLVARDPGPPAPSADSGAASRSVSVRLGSLRVLTALIFCVALTAGTLVVLVSARLERGEPIRAFSILLDVVGILVMATVLAGYALNRVTVHADGEVCVERSIGPFLRSRRSVRRQAIRGVFPTSAESNRIDHLLLSTDDGPIAFPCPSDAVDAVLRAVDPPHSIRSVPGMHMRS